MGAYYRRVSLRAALLSALVSAVVLLVVAASAGACPAETERAREVEPYASHLPDCRAYEQVSPVDKNAADASGDPGFVESSSSGNSVSYFSLVPFPEVVGATEFSSYLSARVGDNWVTQGLLPLTEPYAGAEVLGFINNNNEAVVYVGEEESMLLAPGAVAGPGDVFGNVYLRNNLTGEYRLIAAGVGAVQFAGGTPSGSVVLFSAILGVGQELGGVTDPNFVPYVFEWNRETGQVSLVGEVGGGAPQEGAVAGTNENGGVNTYDQNAISETGSRIFFSQLGEVEGEKLYMREPNANRTVDVSEGDASWRAATPDGSEVFYTEDEKLFLFNVDMFEASKKPEPEALAEAREELAGSGAEVLGTLGISNDGTYVYFVAEGVLAGDENGNGEKAEPGEANLYEWHQSNPIEFIARLKLSVPHDESDWEGYALDEPGASEQGYKASRVSLDGTKVLISSKAKLTSYNNAENHEIYLYTATEPLSATNPRCVSCNNAIAAAKYPAYLSLSNAVSVTPFSAFMTRNLSREGTRVFFQTQEALLPQATNGQENVYEWEKEGVGKCGVNEGDESGGCLYLISTGQSTNASYFGDASENGEDIFFFTRQSLVSQDRDDNADIYDAREDGGIAEQNPASSEAPCESETCRGAPGSGPAFGAPSSLTVSGSGDLAPPAELRAPTKLKAKPLLTSTQRLAKALEVCDKKQKRRQRARCKAQATKKYGGKAKNNKTGEK
jgi:hypothetical protein